MVRQILVVGQSAVMRKIIRTMVEANINDATVREAQNDTQALESIRTNDCHLVLYLLEDNLVEEPLAVFTRAREIGGQRRTPFLFLIDGKNSEDLQKVGVAEGADCLAIPCSADALAVAVDRACPLFSMRRFARFSVPQTMARLEQRRLRFEGRVINFSKGGVLCEIDLLDDYVWSQPVMATLDFQIEGKSIQVSDLYGFPVRLQVIESNPDYTPKCMRVAFSFIHPPPASLQAMQKVIDLILALESSLRAKD